MSEEQISTMKSGINPSAKLFNWNILIKELEVKLANEDIEN
jgi:hypothetical protein